MKESNNIDVSLIIPVHNTREDYLSGLIDSALAQHGARIEIIIIDDGSEYDTAALCDDYAQRHEQIKVFHQDPMGVSAARNNGIVKSSGSWIAFLDADDLVTVNFIAHAYEAALETNADLICGRQVYRFGDFDVDKEWGFGEDETWRVTDDPVELFDLQKRFLSCHYPAGAIIPDEICTGPVAKLYKRSAIGDIRFSKKLTVSEDALFNFKIASVSKRVAYIDEAWYIYIQHPKSSVHSVSAAGWLSNITEYGSEQHRRLVCGDRELNNCIDVECSSMAIQAIDNALRVSNYSEAGNLRVLLESSFVKECTARADFDKFILPSWRKLVYSLMKRGMYRTVIATMSAKVALSKKMGKRV